ncbi:MAG: hypothetical protein ACI4NE_08085 [Succinivibrio sp.]
MNSFRTKFLPLADYPIIATITLILIISIFQGTSLYSDVHALAVIVPKTIHTLRYVGIFLFLLYYIVYRPGKKALYIFLAFIVVDMVLKRFTDNHRIFELFFIPFCLCQFVNRKRLYVTLLGTAIVCFLIVSIGHYFGYFQNALVFARKGFGIRYTFGFLHPNTLGLIVLIIAFFYTMMKKSVALVDIALFTGLFLFTYFVPNSMTTTALLFLMTVYLIASYVLTKRNTVIIQTKYKTILFISIVCIIILILSVIYYITYTGFGREFLIKLPGSLWARFVLARNAFIQYGLNWFGTHTPIVKDVSNVVDCAYFFIPLQYGIVLFVLFIALILTIFKMAIFRGEYRYAFILLLVMLYGISEMYIINPMFMPIYAYIFCESDTRDVGYHKVDLRLSS